MFAVTRVLAADPWWIAERIMRDQARRRAELAPRLAHEGEPHARARARILALEDEHNRNVERELLYGAEKAPR